MSWKIPGSDILTAFSAGAQAAAKEINAEGGFGGHPVSLSVCNSMLQPAGAAACAHSTFAQHPVAEFGCDEYWFAAGLPVYSAAKIPSINCLTSPVDFSNPYSFGLNASGVGEDYAAAKYACSLPSVKTFVTLVYSDPADESLYTQHEKPVIKACGKTSYAVFFPATATDVAPYVAKALQYKPGFVLVNASDVAVIQIYKTFEASGFPASKIASPDNNFTYQDTSQAGKVYDNALVLAAFEPWTSTTAPGMPQYFKAMQGSSTDPRNGTAEWGYSDLMFIYNAAKQIGFSNFSSATLEHYLSTASATIPLSTGAFVNPGPKGSPQEKQPYTRVAQWTGSTFKFISGRIYGY